jgi:membrane-bound lytic murein transglycosylase A
MRHSCAILPGLVLLVLAAGACTRRKDYQQPLPPGMPALTELAPHQWPRFTLRGSRPTDIALAVERSLHYLGKPSSQRTYPLWGISHEQVQRGLTRFRQLLSEVRSDDELNAALRREFRVFRSVGWDGSGEVLFTGYYTPIFPARLQPDTEFRWPIHRLPADLEKGADNTVIATQVLPDGTRRPYPGRRELERSGALKGLELAWLADPFDAYIINVQGSARLLLADGRPLEVGYAGCNGHPYVSINHALVADGRIAEDECNLATMRAFFRAHPELVAEYVNRNQRVVFFQEAPGGPFGCLGEVVTPDVSLATDKKIFPAGALCYVVETAEPKTGARGEYAGFRCDQDRGGAITAPGRADLFMGIGEAAEHRAGRQYAEGFLYYLVAR